MLPLAGESPLGPLLPEHIEELFVGLILFAIILAVMWKVVVPMFEKTYAERTAAIQGGIEKAEAALYASKVMPVCPKCGKATRVGHTEKDGKKVRVCKKCGAEL